MMKISHLLFLVEALEAKNQRFRRDPRLNREFLHRKANSPSNNKESTK